VAIYKRLESQLGPHLLLDFGLCSFFDFFVWTKRSFRLLCLARICCGFQHCEFIFVFCLL
jgi:hypothetical protein